MLCLQEPFVVPSIIAKESQKTATPGEVQEQLTKTPEWINGEMRSYQLEGLTWLLQQHKYGVSGILGDEMGLGKTLQTIAFLSTLKYQEKLDGPFLVVCPVSAVRKQSGAASHGLNLPDGLLVPPIDVCPLLMDDGVPALVSLLPHDQATLL